MNRVPSIDPVSFNNILYIGEEPKACLSIIEKFNDRLREIEHANEDWFNCRAPKNGLAKHDKLQYHIHYHFEGGLAIFRFRDEDTLPARIREECFIACRNLVAEQFLYAS